MPYTQADYWRDLKMRGFRDAVTAALVALLPGDDPEPPDPDPEPPVVDKPGNSENAPGQTKPPKTK